MQQGPLPPRALPPVVAPPRLAATVAPSADFPGVPVLTTDLLHRWLDGTRTVSPVARHALVTVLPLTTPPEWQTASSARGLSCCLRPEGEGSASGIIFCRGHHWVHLRCGPVTRLPSRRWLCRSASSASFPPQMRPVLQGF